MTAGRVGALLAPQRWCYRLSLLASVRLNRPNMRIMPTVAWARKTIRKRESARVKRRKIVGLHDNNKRS